LLALPFCSLVQSYRLAFDSSLKSRHKSPEVFVKEGLDYKSLLTALTSEVEVAGRRNRRSNSRFRQFFWLDAHISPDWIEVVRKGLFILLLMLHLHRSRDKFINNLPKFARSVPKSGWSKGHQS